MTNARNADLDLNFFALFAREAARRPHATAIIDESGPTTYGALLRRAGVIAHSLTTRGLGAEQPVGVLMKRTADLVASLLGIAAAGGCYLPLDPDDPTERTRRIVASASCKIVLGNWLLLEEFRTRDGAVGAADTVELVDVERLATAGHGAGPPSPAAPGGQRLAYILFTSGTTGAPKGVEVEHRNVVQLLLSARDLFGFTEADRWLATSSIAFDLSVAELFLPLITGGVVVLRDRRLLQDPHGLAKVIRDQGITMFQTVPSVWSVVLKEVPDFPRIRTIATTGEAAPPELARRLIDYGDEVWNLYGPTETTVWATGHRLQRNDTSRSAAVAIGRPLAHVEVRLLDEHRRPVPHGTEGELWIGGESLARGYRSNEQLTHDRFAELGPDGKRFYRSGDLVVADADGTLHYFGRSDDQMKIRGVRIEPMEVEAAIVTCPGVTQAAATWFATTLGSRAIVAAVVTGTDHTVSAEDLHRYLMRMLPATMVPSRFIFVEALPVSAGGKIDRKAIRDRVAEQPPRPAAQQNGTALTTTEAKLIEIWERTLNVRPVSRTDHFFTIGGDSLSAVTMLLDVEAAFDVSLDFSIVYEVPGLEQLAERVDRDTTAKTTAMMKGPHQPGGLSNSAFVFPLVQQGRGRPMFFANANFRMAGKNLWTLDCPLYAMSQWALGHGFSKPRSLEELASSFIDGVRAIQPRGPYRLGGYSFGGLVVLEMAQQLRRAGEAIEMLFLLDPSEPYTDGYRMIPRSDLAAHERESLGARALRRGRLLASDASSVPAYAAAVSRTIARTVLETVDRRTRRPAWEWLSHHLVDWHGRNPNAISKRLLPRNRWPAFWHLAQRLSRDYVPQPYDGNVLAMFISHRERQDMWRRLLGPSVDFRLVECAHLEMFAEPALSLWLTALGDRLDGRSSR